MWHAVSGPRTSLCSCPPSRRTLLTSPSARAAQVPLALRGALPKSKVDVEAEVVDEVEPASVESPKETALARVANSKLPLFTLSGLAAMALPGMDALQGPESVITSLAVLAGIIAGASQP